MYINKALSHFQNMNWPPTEDDFKSIAASAVRDGPESFHTVLVYADNPGIIIFDPVSIGPAACMRRYITVPDTNKQFVVIISEID